MANIFNKKDENDKDDKVTTAAQVGTNNFTNPSAAPNAYNGQPASSGRFTNLQKFIDANKTGGQKLATGIGSKLQKDIEPAKTDTNKYNQEVASGIAASKGTLAKGEGNLNQLKTIGTNITNNTGQDKYLGQTDLGIQTFANDPGYNDFKNIQSGKGVNENLLSMNQSALTNSSKDYLEKSQNAQKDVGSESGRFSLLKNTFGGNINPSYNVGQQKLDQALLQRSNLNDLKSNLSNEVNNATTLNKGTFKTGQDVNSVIASEQDLINNISKQATTNEDAFVNMLSSYVPGVNAERDAEWAKLNTAIANSKQGASSSKGGLTSDQVARLGVTTPTQVYNVFNGLDNAGDLATKGMAATNYKDVVNDGNLSDYNYLADILGMNDANKRVSETSKLGDSYTARTDDGSLTNRAAAAKAAWETQAKKDGIGRYTGAANYKAPNMYEAIVDGKDIYSQHNSFANPLNTATGSAYDKQMADYIKNTGFGNVLTPDGFEKISTQTSAGQDYIVDSSGNKQTSGYNVNNLDNKYNSQLDDDVRARLAAINELYKS